MILNSEERDILISEEKSGKLPDTHVEKFVKLISENFGDKIKVLCLKNMIIMKIMKMKHKMIKNVMYPN